MKELIPWYLNNTLSPADRRKVETWLARRPDGETLLAEYEQVHQVVQGQPFKAVSPEVGARLRARIDTQPRPTPVNYQPTRWTWVFGLLLMTAVLFGLWFTFQPGVILEWSAGGKEIETFQIYRAAQGSSSFEMLHELKPNGSNGRFSYVDLALWPGRTYSYHVIGIAADGQVTNSPVVTGDTWILIQTQLAIILISLFAGYGGVVLTRSWRPSQRFSMPVFG